MTLSHIDKDGKASMVDVSDKDVTFREATARGKVKLNQETFDALKQNKVKKGDVLAVSNLAGIGAAKKTSELIPLTHQINLSNVNIDFDLNETENEVIITANAKAKDSTGVEMEALTAVAVSALTIYDMCKAMDRAIEITDLKLILKSGGKSGKFVNE